MLRSTLALALLSSVALPAMAAEIPVEAQIAAVVVYPQGALVTREVPFSIPAGASTLLVADVPAGIDTSSLHIEGAAGGAVEIRSVETRPSEEDPSEDPARIAIEDRIQGLQDQIAVLDDRLKALEQQHQFVENLIDQTPRGFSQALGDGSGSIDQWTAATVKIGETLTAIDDEARKAALARRGLKKQVAAAQDEINALPTPVPHLEVRIEVGAEAAASGTLELSYQSMAAGWAPAYDAHLTLGAAGDEPSLLLIRRAEVTQSTGEDWTGVALTLSTARPAGGLAAPPLGSDLVSFYEVRPYDSVAAGASAEAMAPMRAPAPATAGMLADAPVGHQVATADFGDFRAEYRVAGTVDIESGTAARSLRIAEETDAATLEVRATPVLSATAYLHARFTSASPAPLLGGAISLFRDGAYVGADTLPFTNPGSEVSLGFGADDQVKVERITVERTTGTHGLLSSETTDQRRYLITVQNLHSRPLAITVYDRIPYAEDDRIRIDRLDGMTPPTAENVEDQRGVLAWTYDYAAGEKHEIRNEYSVSWPASETIDWSN